MTVVLITHDPAIAGDAPRVVRLADGEIADDGRGDFLPAAVGGTTE